MKHTAPLVPFLLLASNAFCEAVPTHLKYFGFAMVDMHWDDPQDTSKNTNYIDEVKEFSNIAQLGIFSPADNIAARVDLMNSKCVKPILSLQSIFFETTDSLAPSGNHLSLVADYQARWELFKSVNFSSLNASKIAAFYVVDEPTWNGLSYTDLNTASALLKSEYPNIPQMIIEAAPALSKLQIPSSMDWVGFDEYGIFDPTVDPTYQQNFNTIKSKRSDPKQKLMLIIDDQWLPFYGAAGFPPDTMQYVVQNYFKLAASDTDVVGMIGYLWAGGLDNPNQLGVRDMPVSVINKNIDIGRLIKSNHSPCTISNTKTTPNMSPSPTTYSNAKKQIILSTSNEDAYTLEVSNAHGEILVNHPVCGRGTQTIDATNWQQGIYYIRATGKQATKNLGSIFLHH